MLDDDCRTGRHVLTAWSTVVEVIADDITAVTLVRRCVLCSYREDARREPEEQAA